MFFYTILILGGIVVIEFISIYNILITKKNRVDEAWSDIDVQMKRRYDLIPNLVEVIKGYAMHEKNVLESVTEARTRAMGATTTDEHAKAEDFLTNTLKTLFAVSENYPDLKANVNFLDLQRELADTENKIQAARRFYNANVMDYNTTIEQVPNNFVAQYFGHAKRAFFELKEEAAREPVKTQFKK